MIHILQSCIEEEEEDNVGNFKEMLPDDQSLIQPDEAIVHPPDSLPTQDYESPSVDPPWVSLKHVSQSRSPVGVSSVALSVLGFLVDTATGNKVQTRGPQLLSAQLLKGNKNYHVVGKPIEITWSKQ